MWKDPSIKVDPEVAKLVNDLLEPIDEALQGLMNEDDVCAQF